MVWCALAVGFAYKILISLNSLYFGGEETGERSLGQLGCGNSIYSVIQNSIAPSKELCSKMALGEVGV